MRWNLRVIAVVSAASLLVGTGCGGGACGAQSSLDTVSATITGGTISLTDAAGTVVMSTDAAFSLEQTGAGGLPFELDITSSNRTDSTGEPIDGTTRFHCDDIGADSLKSSQTMSLVTFCGCAGRRYCMEADVFRNGVWEQFDLSAVNGTASVEAGGDPSAPGTTAVTLDLATVSLTDSGSVGATLTIDSIRGTEQRADVPTANSGSCGGGGGSSYGGFLPGGD